MCKLTELTVAIFYWLMGLSTGIFNTVTRPFYRESLLTIDFLLLVLLT